MNALQKRTWRKFELTADKIERMERFAEAGQPLSVVAKAFKVSPTTIKSACKTAKISSWLDENFPNKQGHGGGGLKGELKSKLDGEIRKLGQADTLEPLNIPSSVQTKWLTRAWRKAA